MELLNYTLTEFIFTSLGVLLVFLVVSLWLTPRLIKFLKKHDQTDKPNERKLQKEAIPSSGGVLFLSTLIIFLCLFLPKTEALIAGLSSFGLLIVGYMDDKHDLSAKTKFIAQFLCAFLVLTQLDPIHILESDHNILNYIITFMFIVGFTNAFNLMDGVDALAGTFALIVLSLFTITLVIQENYSWALYSTSIIGVLLAFLHYNKNPAKIYLGDTGSLFLGFTISIISIVILNNQSVNVLQNTNSEYNYLLILGILFLPMMDTIRAMLYRITNKQSPFKADQNHLHYYFLKAGLTVKQVPVVTALLTTVFFVETYILLSNNTTPLQICTVLTLTASLGFIILLTVRLKQYFKQKAAQKQTIENLYTNKKILIKPEKIVTI